MYNAEVLSKFPVVQHFPFGSLFSFERDPTATPPPTTAHSTSGPQGRPVAPDAGNSTAPASRPSVETGTRAPWAAAGAPTRVPPPAGPTAAPWAATRRDGPSGTASLPDTSRLPPGSMAPTRAPWASAQPAPPPPELDGATKAPWAK